MPELLEQAEEERTEHEPTPPDTDEGDDGRVSPDGGVTAASVDATFEIPTGAGTVRMSVPETATPDEAAAVAAAVAAHFDEEATEAEADEADRWTLAGRLGCRSPEELPRACSRGDEWTASARVSW